MLAHDKYNLYVSRIMFRQSQTLSITPGRTVTHTVRELKIVFVEEPTSAVVIELPFKFKKDTKEELSLSLWSKDEQVNRMTNDLLGTFKFHFRSPMPRGSSDTKILVADILMTSITEGTVDHLYKLDIPQLLEKRDIKNVFELTFHPQEEVITVRFYDREVRSDGTDSPYTLNEKDVAFKFPFGRPLKDLNMIMLVQVDAAGESKWIPEDAVIR